jgi:asparagine synthase (glutamine-hydrolysing)
MTDEPLADLATIPLFRVCEFARRDVKVLMSGEGSDEILAGYHYDQLARKYDILRLLRKIPAGILRKLPHQFFRRMGQVGWTGLARDLAAHPTLGTRQSSHAIELVRKAYDGCISSELIDQMQEVMMQGWLTEDLLMKADKASMAASVELRCPFLDHELAEFSFKLPMHWKVGSFTKGYTTKRILREYAKTRLPASIIHRSKQGFPVPSTAWLRDDLSDWAHDIFMDSNLDSVTPKNARETMWSDFKNGTANNADDIWRLIILSLWQKRWLA